MVKMTKVCKEVMKYLEIEYGRKGYNFLFNVRKINIDGYSSHLKGMALKKLYSSGSIEQWGSSKSSPMLYKTRFSR